MLRSWVGTDHIESLWLLCQVCNSSKVTKISVEFLRDRMSKRRPVLEWLISPKWGQRLFTNRKGETR